MQSIVKRQFKNAMSLRTRIALLFGAVFVCLCALACFPSQAHAAPAIDVDRPSSLTIHHEQDGSALEGARFEVYRIASVNAYAEYTVTEQFAEYPISFDCKNAEEWDALATTLKGYVALDDLEPLETVYIEKDGNVTLSDLETGLYLVIGAKRTVGDLTYTVTPAIVMLPQENVLYNDWDYEVTINPKATSNPNPGDDPSDRVITRKAQKVWNDAGQTTSRPDEVVFMLLQDGEVYDTIVLPFEGRWTYFWDNLPARDEDGAVYEYDIVEIPIEGYTTTSKLNIATFVVTNTPKAKEAQTTLPQTGQLWWPVPVLSLAGLVCLIAGLRMRKSNR